jgi:hypothetical protein
MTDLEDKWIEERGTKVDAKLLHAIGLINLIWNTCEHGLLPIFCAATKIRGQMASILIHDLGDISISNKIRDALPLSQHDQDEKDAITYALELYDINRINRNQLHHFSPDFINNALVLYRKKGPVLGKEPFPSDLKTVRRIADEVMALAIYLANLGNYFVAKMYENTLGALPNRPPLPEKLWKPAPQTPSKPPRQRQPSRASRRKAALVRRKQS